MSEMVNVNAQKLADNLVEIAAMAQELEEYIIGNEVYRTVLISVAGDHRSLLMSGGDLLTRLNQLKENREKLPQAQQDQLKTVEADIQRTIYSLRTRFHELLRRELKSRHDQLNWNMEERGALAEPDAAEINNQHRITTIEQELSSSTR
jgi:hypothetical protein